VIKDVLPLIEYAPEGRGNALMIGCLQVTKPPMNIGLFKGRQLVNPRDGWSKQACAAPVIERDIEA
jgi:hypothetical protein